MSRYYDETVKPGYYSLGFDPPNKELWIEQVRKGKATIDDYFPSTNTKQLANMTASAEIASGQLFHGMVMAGAYIDKQAAHAILGLDSIFPFATMPTDEQNKQRLSNIDKQYDNREEAYRNSKLGKISTDMINSASFWLQTHPSNSYVEKIDSLVGENIIQLPLYESIGAARIALGTGVAKTAGVEAASNVLAKGMPKFTNLTKTLASSKVGQFAARRLGEASDGFIGASLASQTDSEKMNTMLAWMGIGAGAEGIRSVAGAISAFAIKKFLSKTAAVGGRPLVDAAFTQAEHEVEEAASSSIKPEEAINDLKTQHEEDPVKHQLVLGAKAVLHTTAMNEHNVPWSELGPIQKMLVRQRIAEATGQAIDETVLHNPEIIKAKVESEQAEEFKNNPWLKEQAEALEKKYGIKVSDAVVNAEKAQVESTTGVKNSSAAIEKVDAALRNRPATLSAKERSATLYASFKVNNLVYFKNPLGAKAKTTTLKDYLEDLDSKDFKQELRDNVGNFPFFEKDAHLLLWAWKYKDQMPIEFRRRIEEELFDTIKGTPATWDKKAINQEAHLQKLADTGRLASEKNVFGSSNFNNWKSRTTWQRDLDKEQEAAELLIIQKAFRRFPDAAANAESIIRKLQAIRAQAPSASRDLKLTQRIKDTTAKLTSKINQGVN